MADSDQFEYNQMQLAGSLNAVAESMRNCATIADHFAQVVKNTPFTAETALQVVHGLKNSSLPATTPGKRKAKAIEEDLDGKKKRKTKQPKKIRDPDMPKRPASSYLLFQNEIRKELKSQNPNMTQSELLSMIAKQWAEMNPEQKTIYTSATATAKEKYHQDKAAYDAKVPSTTVVAVPPPAPAPTLTPTLANKKTFKSQPVVSSSDSGSSNSASEAPSSSEADEDEEEEEEVQERPPAKKPKQQIVPTPKVKKYNRA
jgi:hypothetical protein